LRGCLQGAGPKDDGDISHQKIYAKANLSKSSAIFAMADFDISVPARAGILTARFYFQVIQL
jgi:hypothetical protein